MSGNCGGLVPKMLPLLVGPPVDRCPVWLGHQEDAVEIERLAADIYTGMVSPPSDGTPFVKSLTRQIAAWKRPPVEDEEGA